MTSKADRSNQQREELSSPTPSPAKGYVCPFVANPMPDCHCAQMTSLHIPLVLECCAGGYEQCELFRRRQDGRPLTDGEIPLQHSIRDKEDP